MKKMSRVPPILWALLFSAPVARSRAEDWAQWRGSRRDGRWREQGVVTDLPADGVRVLWRAPVSSGYTGPSVAEGRVYVSDRVTAPAEKERVLCFDAMTGEPLWTHSYACAYRGVSYPAGPRASITVDTGRAYSLGTMGALCCLDAGTGSVIWQRDLDAEYAVRMPTWGLSSAPLVDRGLVIVQIGGRDGACLVALRTTDGKEVWRALDDRASYSAPILIEQAGQRVLVCWTGDRVVGLDPASGALHWEHPFPSPRMVIGIADPVVDNGRLFISDFFEGALMLELEATRLAVRQVWRRKGTNERQTDALHALIGTPIVAGDLIYGIDSYGELRCLEAATGERVWESLEVMPRVRWGTVHMVPNGEYVWMFSEHGELLVTQLSRAGPRIISRAQLIQPMTQQHARGVCWTHPAFAYRRVFVRNDEELICADLAAPPKPVLPAPPGRATPAR